MVTTIEQNMKSLTETTSLQSLSLAEIMGAVRILDRITRENAQLATSTTELSRCVAQGALHVGEVVSTFKLNRRGAIREPGPPEGGAKLQNHAIR